jgi:hypothetical protein
MMSKPEKHLIQRAAAGLVCVLCAGAVHAQGQGGLSGDLSYTRGSGSGGYGSHSVAASIEPAVLPLTLGFNATQGLVDSAEVSTQVGVSMGWRVSPLWTVTANLSTTNDDLFNVSARGLAVAWNLNKLWQGKLTTRLELERTVSDYSLQKGTQNLSGSVPQQRRTRLDLRQGLSDAADVYVGLETYDYSQDPEALARALLNRKVRRVAAAGMLGDLSDRSQTVGLNWNLAEAWSLDLSTGLSSTVIGQNQRQRTAVVNYMFHPRSSITLTWSDSSADAMSKPNGAILTPAQSDSTVEMGLRWLF